MFTTIRYRGRTAHSGSGGLASAPCRQTRRTPRPLSPFPVPPHLPLAPRGVEPHTSLATRICSTVIQQRQAMPSTYRTESRLTVGRTTHLTHVTYTKAPQDAPPPCQKHHSTLRRQLTHIHAATGYPRPSYARGVSHPSARRVCIVMQPRLTCTAVLESATHPLHASQYSCIIIIIHPSVAFVCCVSSGAHAALVARATRISRRQSTTYCHAAARRPVAES